MLQVTARIETERMRQLADATIAEKINSEIEKTKIAATA
jgi:hypothetical protein